MARVSFQIDPHDPQTWAPIRPCAPTHDLVYRLRDSCGLLLYVGVTWCPRERWIKHRRRTSWWPRVASVEVECFSERWRALRAELVAIKQESPVHNIRGVVA